MSAIKAIVKDGRLELDVPADWPDGTQVEIHPIADAPAEDAMSPAEIARTLAAMDQLTPFEMTSAEIAAWEEDRRSRKEREKAEFSEHAEKLRKMWD